MENNCSEPDYRYIINLLVEKRKTIGFSQKQLADKLECTKQVVSDIESFQKEIDVVLFCDWTNSLGYSFNMFSDEVVDTLTLLQPSHICPMSAEDTENGILLNMVHQNGVTKVFIENVKLVEYQFVEQHITTLYQSLNNKNCKLKNRDAIFQAIEFGITSLSQANPSDIYQHIVYRLYLREYIRSDPEQSWRRAGGEAVELFIQSHYQVELEKRGIKIEALISNTSKRKALLEMGLEDEIGGSKLDVVLYGNINGTWVIFGGVHSKASLAERVSDDVPASLAMMRKGLLSILYTFDSKSFPPPHGNLVNKGELGSFENPSDKRKYIEEHGSFDACFSYNTRSQPSINATVSGKKIYVSKLDRTSDHFVDFITENWETKQKNFRKASGPLLS